MCRFGSRNYSAVIVALVLNASCAGNLISRDTVTEVPVLDPSCARNLGLAMLRWRFRAAENLIFRGAGSCCYVAGSFVVVQLKFLSLPCWNFCNRTAVSSAVELLEVLLSCCWKFSRRTAGILNSSCCWKFRWNFCYRRTSLAPGTDAISCHVGPRCGSPLCRTSSSSLCRNSLSDSRWNFSLLGICWKSVVTFMLLEVTAARVVVNYLVVFITCRHSYSLCWTFNSWCLTV